MKLSQLLYATCLLLPFAAPGVVAQESPQPAAPAEPVYVPLEKLRSFYKLLPQPGNAAGGIRSVGNAGTTISFGPGKKDITIGGYRCKLSHPVREDGAGDLLISEVDMVKLIDPILRPTYISERRLVRTVVLDPGHGGYDAGTVGDKVREADFVLQLAAELKEMLTKRGYKVELTHAQNRHLSDHRRIEVANQADAPIFISLHLNSGRSDIQGIETYTAAPAEQGETLRPANRHDAANISLAFALHSSLVSATGAQDGSCRRAQFNLLNSVDCPSALLLLGYATHGEEGELLATPEYRSKLAAAITEGISTFALAINPDASLEPAPEVVPEPPAPVRVEAPTPKPTKTKPKSTKSKPKTSSKSSSKKSRRNNRRK